MQPDELKALRKGQGMTQDQFAAALGISRKVVNEMENGKAAIERRTELAARYLAAARAGLVVIRELERNHITALQDEYREMIHTIEEALSLGG